MRPGPVAACLAAALLIARPALAQLPEPPPNQNLKITGGFDTIYSRGSFVPMATPGGPARFDDGQLHLDGSYTDLARIGRAELGLEAKISPLGSIRMSGLLLSTDVADQPLTFNAYSDYTAFLRQRWQGGSPFWNRTFLLGDVLFQLADPRLPGSQLVVGQQWLPFGYTDGATMLQPIAIAPQLTPLSEYVNALRLANGLAPWQLSMATRQRQIGTTLKAVYSGVSVTTGVYTGAGPTQADNNGALDFLARADYTTEGAPLGVGASFWYGTQPGLKQSAASVIPYDRIVAGAHARLPYDQWTLTAEYALRWDNWRDGTSSPSRGGYLTLAYNMDLYSQIALQGAYVQHDNPFDSALAGYTGFINRQATLTFKRRINDYADVQTEYAYTWEDLTGTQSTGVHYGQFLSRVHLGF